MLVSVTGSGDTSIARSHRGAEMVLRDYGAAPAGSPHGAGAPAVRPGRARSLALVGVAVAAVSLLVAAVAVGGTGAGAALEQEQLHSQHLMSQHAISATAAADDGDSAHWYGHWGNHDDSSSASSTNWQKELKVIQARQKARRAREDDKFFAGVDKAFGKKAGAAMLAVLNGKGKNVLSKFKINEKKLAAQKAKIIRNRLVPSTRRLDHVHKAHRAMASKHAAGAATAGKGAANKAAVVAKTAAKLAAKKIPSDDATAEALRVAKKMAEHTDPVAKPDAKGKPAVRADAVAKGPRGKGESKTVVKEALKIATKMAEHVDPVAKTSPTTKTVTAAKKAVKEVAKAVKKVKKESVKALQHQGIMATSKELEKTVKVIITRKSCLVERVACWCRCMSTHNSAHEHGAQSCLF